MPDNKPRKGRKPREQEAGFAPLTVRLAEKTRFALDLLAKVQGRSLSQAVEWALIAGCQSHPVGGTDPYTVGELADEIWPLAEPERLLRLFHQSEFLVDFDDRAPCALAIQCVETNIFVTRVGQRARDFRISREKRVAATIAVYLHTIANIFYATHWNIVRPMARAIVDRGLQPKDLSMVDLLRSSGFMEEAEKFKAATEAATNKALKHFERLASSDQNG